MKQINGDYQKGSQKVVFDHVTSTMIGGAHVDKTEAAKRFPDLVLPAGTALVPHTDGTYKPLTDITAENAADIVGLTHFDVVIDDMPLVAVVNGGTARIEALPEVEQLDYALIKTAVPTIIFY